MRKIKKYGFITALILISAFRMFLAVNTNYAVIAGKFDDELAIHWGYSLISGEWLGEYSYTTLIKGITYPCFVALLKVLGLTYGQGLGILMITASLIFIRMFYKFNKNRFIILLAYIFVLFNPAGFSGWTALHIYRDVMTIWLLLILFSCVIAIYDNRKLPWRSSGGWICGGLISYVMLYYLREDSVWIYPFMIFSVLICATSHYLSLSWEYWYEKAIRIVLCTAIPWICVGVVGLAIASLNYHYYGIFCVNDRTQGPFAEMMKLIYQVEDDTTDEDVWITDKMLWKCVNVSPTLNGMREAIENRFEAAKEEDGQIHGDLLQWELRTAFRDVGYYQDAVDTKEMLEQVVTELENAYENGNLERDSKIHLSAQGRGMTVTEIFNYLPEALIHFFDMANYEGCYSYYPYYPQANEELVEKFEIMLSTPLSEEYIDSSAYVFVENVYAIINKIYHRLGELVLKLCCILFCISVIGEVIRYKKDKNISKELDMSLPLAGIMLSGYLLIYMITVFTSFLTVYNFYNYTTGVYIIHGIFEVFVANNLWHKGLKLKEHIICKK